MKNPNLYHNHYSLSNEEIEAKKNNEYTIISRDIPNNTITLKHNVCGTIFTTTLKLFFKAKIPCPKCTNSKIKLTNEEFLERVKNSPNGGDYTFLEEYKGMWKKIRVHHNICGHEYMIKPGKFLQGRRCPNCVKNKKLTLEEIKEDLKDLVVDEYSILDTNETYTSTANKLHFKHNICGREFYMKKYSFFKENGNRCPLCAASHAEVKITKYLSERNIKFTQQYIIPEFDKRKRFDFYIEYNENKFILEYDGEFHFTPMSDSDYSLDKFNKQQLSDKEKTDYCKNHNIKLVRIPYWYFDKLDDILDKILKNNEYMVMETSKTINEEINF